MNTSCFTFIIFIRQIDLKTSPHHDLNGHGLTTFDSLHDFAVD